MEYFLAKSTIPQDLVHFVFRTAGSPVFQCLGEELGSGEANALKMVQIPAQSRE